MRRVLLSSMAFLVILLLAATSLAVQPVIKDRKGASRLQPKTGSFNELEAQKRKVVDTPKVEHNWELHMSAHARFVGIPGEVLGLFFADYQPFFHGSAGLAVEFGHPRSELITVELDWTGGSFPDANWREKGVGPKDAKFAEIGLHMISVDATYRDIIHVVDALDFYYGAGLGLAGLVGEAKTTEVLPICSEPVSNCEHWRNVSRADLDMPTRVIPVVHLMAGFQIEFEGVRARFDLGFKNVFYVGLSAGFDL